MPRRGSGGLLGGGEERHRRRRCTHARPAPPLGWR